jgi:xylan 1,4-beta-xylosidase
MRRINSSFYSGLGIFLCVGFLSSWLSAQPAPTSVSIQVKADQTAGTLKPIWNYFGYDEPNYTYAPDGKKLLGELAAMSPVPVHVRTHNLFTTGDGASSLKWGSTNAYTEDANGKPVYNWTIVDHIFDTYHELGIKPLVELGFMPQALSVNPEPYRHNFPQGQIFTGWAYPPKSYEKWGELVFHFVQHLRERYGDAETKSWMWEVWNEPDIPYWKGTAEEYLKLYDYSVDAVLRALPGTEVGGPDSTGPGNDRAAEFLRLFLEHCARGKNYVTGKSGAPLDFISFHPKGAPVFENGHVRMGISRHLAAIDRGFKVVASFPEWQKTPIILGESDPEGCAACSAQQHPENAYRNGPLYAVYTATVLNQIYALAAQEHINFQGAVTWAFEFEDQASFAGFRDLATNGVDKAVLNTFRMFGLLNGERVTVNSTGAISADEMLQSGVRGRPDINAIATRHDREITILAWNYQDDDVPAPDAPVNLLVTGIPDAARTALLEHFRIDGTHSNAFDEWKIMNSPPHPAPDEQRRLESAGQLQELHSPGWVAVKDGQIKLNFALPRQGLSLIKITW